VIWGGYVEQLGDGMAGIVSPQLEHRIDALLNGRSSWSLWIRGPKVRPINIRGCE
jgi:hypothetical protein